MRKFGLLILTILLFQLPNSSWAQQTDEGKSVSAALRYVEYPSSGVLLGQGWDSFRSLPSQQNCIVFSEKIVPGHDVSITSKSIVNRYELNKALKLSMSGSYSGFGAKVSAKAEYSKSLDIDQNNTNILVNVEVWKGDKFIAPSFLPLEADVDTFSRKVPNVYQQSPIQQQSQTIPRRSVNVSPERVGYLSLIHI